MVSKYIVVALGVLCLTPLINAGLALFLGVVCALLLGNPFSETTPKLTSRLLSTAIIGMGAGMNLEMVAKVGLRGVGYTFIGIAATLFLGFLLKKLYKVDSVLAVLISVGTAICGGSAIAAVVPVIRAKSHEASIALGVVFILNAVALFIFPHMGHFFNLSQEQFGLWSALAIHDTSSVVGASLQYGTEALQVGTTTKLARALWIVPVTILISFFVKESVEGKNIKRKKPWFILGFCLAAALVTWVPSLRPVGDLVSVGAKQLLVLTLFIIGLGLTKESLKLAGGRPLFMAITLWGIVASATLIAIKMGVIR